MILTVEPKAGGKYVALDCDITFPLYGAWRGTVSVHSPNAPISGQVILSFADNEGSGTPVLLVGYVALGTGGSRYQETADVVVVGGFGGLSDVIEPRSYQSATAKMIVDDIMTATGESLSLLSDMDALAQSLQWWVRPRGTAGAGLTDLCRHLGLVWRVQLDGRTWIGRETWPDVKYSADILDHDTAQRTLTIDSEYPSILPGMIWQGQKVQQVGIQVGAESNRTLIRYDDDFATTLRKVIEGSLSTAIITARTYPGRVVAQRGDRFDVKIDDQSLPISSVSNVPVRHGLPGVSVTVPAGAKALVAFEHGSLAKPYIAQWVDSSLLTHIAIAGSSRPVARSSDTVDCGSLITSSGLVVAYVPGTATAAEKALALASAGVGAVALALVGKIDGTDSKLRA